MSVRTAAPRRPFSLLSLLSLLTLVLLVFGGSAWALDRGADGWFHTGDGVRVKKVLFANFDVYSISHDMKDLPPTKSKQAVIDMDTDKRFTWHMLRDVEEEKIQNAVREAFAMNHYSDAGKINQYVAAFSGDRKKGQVISISYNSTAKTVSVSVQGGGSATIPGVDFMKAVWSFWFGTIDQPALGDALIRNL
jgi:hypothetical protein